MNYKTLLVLTVILLSSAITGTANADTPRYLHVNTITMELDGPDATISVDYELDIIARLYVLFLGSGNIEPAIIELFEDFEDVRVVSIRDDHAVVKAMNVSHEDQEGAGGLYFHDSHSLGTTVDTFVLVFPSGVSRTFTDVSATPNTFFEA